MTEPNYKIATRSIFLILFVAVATIVLLLWLSFLAPHAMFSRWHTTVTLMGTLASMGVMVWGMLAQNRRG